MQRQACTGLGRTPRLPFGDDGARGRVRYDGPSARRNHEDATTVRCPVHRYHGVVQWGERCRRCARHHCLDAGDPGLVDCEQSPLVGREPHTGQARSSHSCARQGSCPAIPQFHRTAAPDGQDLWCVPHPPGEQNRVAGVGPLHLWCHEPKRPVSRIRGISPSSIVATKGDHVRAVRGPPGQPCGDDGPSRQLHELSFASGIPNPGCPIRRQP